MSYLRGPLTREQIRVLMQGTARLAAPPKPPATETPASTETPSGRATTPAPPSAEPGVWQLVVDGNAGTLVPSLGLRARGTFRCSRPAAECACDFLVSAPLGPDGKPSWKNAIVAGATDDATPPVPHGGPHYAAPSANLITAAAQSSWQLEARQNLGENLEVSVQKSGQVTGAPFEDENEFRLRLEQAAREERDEAVRKLRDKYSAKTRAADQKVARAREVVAQQQAQARSAQMQTAISMGSTLLGAFLGKGRSKLGHMSRASTAARGATRAMKESSDVGTAQEKLAAAQAAAAELEQELEEQITALPSPSDVSARNAETIRLKLMPATLRIESSGILWTA
jgi:hypothetical protein